MQHILNKLYFYLFSRFAHVDEVAITFDDLPSHTPAKDQRVINERILQALQKFNVPTIGFVNEVNLYSQGETQEKIAILKWWIDHGHSLGNHTYSHKLLSNTRLDEFEKDVIEGEKISKKLMADAGIPYLYFRHPGFDTGNTKKIRTTFELFLKKRGYLIAPVSIDSADWVYNHRLLNNPQDKEEILTKYLKHTKARFIYYKAIAKKIFGRNIKHILLLHVNLINSYVMEDLLKIVDRLGYQFVTLDRALEDEAYLEPDNYHNKFGVSWLYRWDYTRGKIIAWEEDNPFIKTKNLTFFDEFRNRSIPIALYINDEAIERAKAGIIKLPVMIIIHSKHIEYSAIATALAGCVAGCDYLVVNIQHDLKNNSELPTPDHQECCVQNILFTLLELKKSAVNLHLPNLNLNKVVLLGHANGSDIVMLFTERYPEWVEKVILLDPLRPPALTENQVPVLSVKKNDIKTSGLNPKQVQHKIINLIIELIRYS